MFKLNNLSPAEGSAHRRKRRGRGIGSGLGKTSGSGHKGQRARSGTSTRMFEGGQMPIYRRLPKRGFSNVNRKDYQVFNIGRLQDLADRGQALEGVLDAARLAELGLINSARKPVRILGDGELSTAVELHVDGASSGATKAVESAGGKIVLKVTGNNSEAAA